MSRNPKKVAKTLKQFAKNQKKGVAWLIDPEKVTSETWTHFSGFDNERSVPDLIFLGGSTYSGSGLNDLVTEIKNRCQAVPLVLFPGSRFQFSEEADAILFLSLISGRNPEFLIDQQVQAALSISQSGLEVLPTGYILVNNGEVLSVHQRSQTLPLLNTEKQKILQTALAGKLLGMKYIFLDAGSGALGSVAPDIIELVKKQIGATPLMIGGGIDSLQKVHQSFSAGADLVVIGNGVEKNPGFLTEVLSYRNWLNHSLIIN
ncbi:geranylgeranylglyceryl/heptaprenylglyceryl phosphate synthase [Algoriphagus hitonicola]|uniref:Geranylgeranylglyceryl phosphate synthase n=1 Tax=Algoriphagus hitonicola TaxID=435880 RepID=A0A1I2SHQ4_9BACT|nr:geranylgeranylglyceryl/heptaprenylglyceryl phosphate synthase [Algoriphagus hitonicola]SFG51239.1 putative glycerol-1-phosphate prenyltransferase [Algoriphagus hitonicola]